MKKIFAISLIAMTAVTSARADIASQAYVDQHDTTTLNSAKSYTDDKIGTYTGAAAGSETVAAAIAAAVSGGTANAVTRSGSDAVGIDDSKPVFVNASGVVTPFTTALGTAAFTPASDYATSSQGTKADTAVQPADIANMQTTTNLVTSMSGSSTDTEYPSAKAVYEAIGASAGVQSVTAATEQMANGTISVDGTAVAVKGLGTAAFTPASDYATAAQGDKADTAVQTVTSTGSGNLVQSVSGNTNGTVTVTFNGTALEDPATTGTDGLYVLTASVATGENTVYKWESIARGTANP